MSGLRISLFGKLSVHHSGQVLDGFEVSKVQELFCYLLIRRQEPQYREALANQLWEESDSLNSRRNLRKSLWQLQKALDAAFTSPKSEPILRVGSDWIRVNQAASYWLDTDHFERAYAPVKGVAGEELTQTMVDGLEQAVTLYRGDLLQGWYQDWCLIERERLQRIYLIMLDKLMRYCEARGRYETGLEYGSRILSYDGARERSHRCIMRLYFLAGDRTEALRQYERCASKLREELGVEPDHRTQALYHQMRADQFPISMLEETSTQKNTSTLTASLVELLESLKQLKQELSANQQHIQEKIEAVEHLINQRKTGGN